VAWHPFFFATLSILGHSVLESLSWSKRTIYKVIIPLYYCSFNFFAPIYSGTFFDGSNIYYGAVLPTASDDFVIFFQINIDRSNTETSTDEFATLNVTLIIQVVEAR
jgi:hypothetical protein